MLTANFYSTYVKAKESQPSSLPQRILAKTENKDRGPSCFPKATVRGVAFATPFGKLASLAANYN